MGQTSYSQDMARGYAGQIADCAWNNVESKVVESAAAPGLVVSRGTDKERQVVKGGTAPIGVLVRDLANENNTGDALVYAAKDVVGVITAGKVLVSVDSAGTAGAKIYVTSATGVVGVGTASTGQVQLNGTLEETITAAGIAMIKLEEQGN